MNARVTKGFVVNAAIAGLLGYAAMGASAYADGVIYGNAGGRVGADQINYVVQTATPSRATGEEFKNSYGPAGGPVGAEAIYQAKHTTSLHSQSKSDFSGWYGRAGGPVGVDVARASNGSVKVGQASDAR
jgi:hypothetical protein